MRKPAIITEEQQEMLANRGVFFRKWLGVEFAHVHDDRGALLARANHDGMTMWQVADWAEAIRTAVAAARDEAFQQGLEAGKAAR